MTRTVTAGLAWDKCPSGIKAEVKMDNYGLLSHIVHNFVTLITGYLENTDPLSFEGFPAKDTLTHLI